MGYKFVEWGTAMGYSQLKGYVLVNKQLNGEWGTGVHGVQGLGYPHPRHRSTTAAYIKMVVTPKNLYPCTLLYIMLLLLLCFLYILWGTNRGYRIENELYPLYPAEKKGVK